MIDIISLLQSLLPYSLAFALSMSIIATIIIDAYYNKSDILSIIVSRKTIVKSRIFILAFIVFYIISEVITKKTPISITEAVKKDWFLLILYVSYEIALLMIRLIVCYKTTVPQTVFEKLYKTLCDRYDGSGGFRVFPEKDANTELWTTSQAIYGLLSGYEKTKLLKYATAAIQNFNKMRANNEVLWCDNWKQNNVLMVPSFWAMISMMKIASKDSYNELIQKELYENNAINVIKGLKATVELQLLNGGWASHSQNNEARVFPTTMAIWMLSEALKNASFINLNYTLVLQLETSLKNGVSLLLRCYNKECSLWSNIPIKKPKRNTISLSLFSYAILSIVSNSLKTLNKDENDLTEFLSGIHNDMMKNVDYCIQKDIEDIETDSPYDNTSIDSKGVVSITFYDWLPITMLSLKASKINGNYVKFYDSIREKRVRDIIVENECNFKDWYTYRLAIILIGLSLEK